MDAPFPRGAPSLAWKVGSVLLPTYAAHLGPNHYRVVIEPPIVVERGSQTGKTGRDAFVEAAIHEFARRMGAVLTWNAGNWESWEPPVV